MVVLSMGRRSWRPGGRSMGSWAHSSSTFLICWRLFQMSSARDSHLSGQERELEQGNGTGETHTWRGKRGTWNTGNGTGETHTWRGKRGTCNKETEQDRDSHLQGKRGNWNTGNGTDSHLVAQERELEHRKRNRTETLTWRGKRGNWNKETEQERLTPGGAREGIGTRKQNRLTPGATREGIGTQETEQDRDSHLQGKRGTWNTGNGTGQRLSPAGQERDLEHRKQNRLTPGGTREGIGTQETEQEMFGCPTYVVPLM